VRTLLNLSAVSDFNYIWSYWPFGLCQYSEAGKRKSSEMGVTMTWILLFLFTQRGSSLCIYQDTLFLQVMKPSVNNLCKPSCLSHCAIRLEHNFVSSCPFLLTVVIDWTSSRKKHNQVVLYTVFYFAWYMYTEHNLLPYSWLKCIGSKYIT